MTSAGQCLFPPDGCSCCLETRARLHNQCWWLLGSHVLLDLD